MAKILNRLNIAFRPVMTADLVMLRRWIASPHWQEWWGEPDIELGYIQDMLEGRDTTKPFIFQVNSIDAGYIQVWAIKDQLFEPWLTKAPWMAMVSEDSVSVDLAIGPSNHISKGIGSAVLSAFVADLRKQGHRTILIDPDPNNLRAVKAYKKAGFMPIPDLIGKTGDSLIMFHHSTTEEHIS